MDGGDERQADGAARRRRPIAADAADADDAGAMGRRRRGGGRRQRERHWRGAAAAAATAAASGGGFVARSCGAALAAAAASAHGDDALTLDDATLFLLAARHLELFAAVFVLERCAPCYRSPGGFSESENGAVAPSPRSRAPLRRSRSSLLSRAAASARGRPRANETRVKEPARGALQPRQPLAADDAARERMTIERNRRGELWYYGRRCASRSSTRRRRSPGGIAARARRTRPAVASSGGGLLGAAADRVRAVRSAARCPSA